MRLEAALFDFDGTLVDTTELIHQSMRHAVQKVLGRELPREVLLANVGQPLPRQMELLDPGRAAELLEVYREHNHAHHDDLIREFPGVEEALSRLKEEGLGVAVVTSKRRLAVEMALRLFPRLGELVDHFVTMEDTSRHKPDPEPLLHALDLLGARPEEAAYVGDSPFDVAAAKAAGLRSVAVSWGAFPESALRAAEPDHLVPGVPEAAELLLRLRREERPS
ncbi:MAG: HAD-IA family hydrolase [Rubrobacter sp.]|nr:HAD-IA family hydrolase [Rubrobacter sp.]